VGRGQGTTLHFLDLDKLNLNDGFVLGVMYVLKSTICIKMTKIITSLPSFTKAQ
jgi:hypothetical protein